MKLMIWVGLTVGGITGGWLGSLLDSGGIGIWVVIGSLVGSLAGIWLGYKLAQNYL